MRRPCLTKEWNEKHVRQLTLQALVIRGCKVSESIINWITSVEVVLMSPKGMTMSDYEAIVGKVKTQLKLVKEVTSGYILSISDSVLFNLNSNFEKKKATGFCSQMMSKG